MSLPNSPSIATFLGNGIAVDFPFTFKVWSPDQLQVLVIKPDAVSMPVPFTASLTSSGGSVRVLVEDKPLPAGWKLSIIRDMPFEQEVDLVSGTRFDPQVIEEALDKATAERQQLREAVGRAIVVPPGNEEPPELLAQQIFDARDSAQVSASDAAQSATEAFQHAERAKYEAESLKSLSVDVEDIGYGMDADAHYDPSTGVLTMFIPEGKTGQQGPLGPEGKQGIAGEEGPQGQRGIQGPQGIQGERGPEGQQGLMGPQGVQGPRGKQGDVGPMGPQGFKGETGNTGERGPQGMEGPKGATGDKGPLGDSPLPLTFGNFQVNPNGYLQFEYNGVLDISTFTINPDTGLLEVNLA